MCYRLPRPVLEPPSLDVFINASMWCRGTRFRDPGSAECMVGLDDLKGLFQGGDSVIIWEISVAMSL